MSAGNVGGRLGFLLQVLLPPHFLFPSFFLLPVPWRGHQEVQHLYGNHRQQHGWKSTSSGFTPQQLCQLRTASLDCIPGQHPWTASLLSM